MIKKLFITYLISIFLFTNAYSAGSSNDGSSSKNKVIVNTSSTVVSGTPNTIRSGAMNISSTAIITKLTAVVTSNVSLNSSSTLGLKVGTAENSEGITQSFGGNTEFGFSGSDVITAGTGTSTDSLLASSLRGSSLSFATGNTFINSSTDIHMTAFTYVTINSGTIKFILEYTDLS